MTQRMIFAGAASVTVNIAPPGQNTQFAMPAVDGSYLDLAITNNGLGPLWIAFAPNLAVGPTAVGCLTVPGLSQVLLTTNAAVLTAVGSSPLVLTGTQATLAQTATAFSAVSANGGSVTIQRGTASVNFSLAA